MTIISVNTTSYWHIQSLFAAISITVVIFSWITVKIAQIHHTQQQQKKVLQFSHQRKKNGKSIRIECVSLIWTAEVIVIIITLNYIFIMHSNYNNTHTQNENRLLLFWLNLITWMVIRSLILAKVKYKCAGHVAKKKKQYLQQ